MRLGVIASEAGRLQLLRRGVLWAVMGAAGCALLLFPAGAWATLAAFPTSKGWVNPAGSGIQFENWGFRSCSGSYLSGVAHLGADSSGAGAGQTVYAIASGTVVRREEGWPGSALGIVHSTATGTRFIGVYGHIVTSLSAGAKVAKGQSIGTIYNQSSDHLHFGVRPLASGENAAAVDLRGQTSCPTASSYGYADPLPWLAGRPAPGSTVTIRSLANGKYASAELGYTGGAYGILRARSSAVGGWEKFRVSGDCQSSTGCGILSLANSRYVSAELSYSGAWNGVLRARASSIGGWERFRVSGDCASSCAIRSAANSKWISAELNYTGSGSAMLRARALSVGGWERFQIR